jgi:hypothetical protein
MLHETPNRTTLKLYQIDFFRTPYDVAFDYNGMSNDDKERLASLDINTSFDYEDEFNNYTILLLTTSTVIDKYKIILFNNIIPNIIKDISDNVISAKQNILDDIEKYRTKKNSTKLNQFKTKLENWIESNLNLDKILDMINENGMESLKPIHLKFLKKI